jgi:hypothetical protein
MEVVEVLWRNDAVQELLALQVLARAQPHSDDVELPGSASATRHPRRARTTHASRFTSSWLIRVPFSSHLTASGYTSS